ncbi:MAG: hypothetical protein AAF629_10200 [Chloroflexota bacterium]
MILDDPAVLVLFSILTIFRLTALVCFIVILVNMFQKESVIHGLIGLLCCQFYVFIWGWLNSATNTIFGAAMLWTVAVGLEILMIVAIAFIDPEMSSSLWGLDADQFRDLAQ